MCRLCIHIDGTMFLQTPSRCINAAVEVVVVVEGVSAGAITSPCMAACFSSAILLALRTFFQTSVKIISDSFPVVGMIFQKNSAKNATTSCNTSFFKSTSWCTFKRSLKRSLRLLPIYNTITSDARVIDGFVVRVGVVIKMTSLTRAMCRMCIMSPGSDVFALQRSHCCFF